MEASREYDPMLKLFDKSNPDFGEFRVEAQQLCNRGYVPLKRNAPKTGAGRRKRTRRRKGGMLKRVADAMNSFPIARPPSSIPLNREQQLKKTIGQLSMQQMEGQNFINDEEKKLKATWQGNDGLSHDEHIKRIKGNLIILKDQQRRLDKQMKRVKQSLSDIHHQSHRRTAKKPADKKGSIQSAKPEGNKHIGDKYLGGKRKKSRRKRKKSRKKRRKRKKRR